MTSRLASCSCGQLSARVDGEPVRISVCHCLACQRRTGSVFAVQARFVRSGVTVAGAGKQFVRVGDEGTAATFTFCPECGATVYWVTAGQEDLIAVAVGNEDEPVAVDQYSGHGGC